MPPRVDLSAFLDSGVSMLGASADEDLMPEAFRVWGAYLVGDGQLRTLISSDAGQTFKGLRPGSAMCFTFSDPGTFASLQVKGLAMSGPEPPGPTDLACMRRYSAAFAAVATARGVPAALFESTRPVAVFAVVVQIEEIYDQTPGPMAGSRLDTER